jgi:hypothetical protein
MKFIYCYVFVFISINVAFGQFEDRTLTRSSSVMEYKEDSYFSKPIQLIDLPTANILKGGALRTSLRLYEAGGALTYLSVGVSSKMMFGISFGGLHVIGDEQVNWNDYPGVNIGFRLVEEDLVLPAISIGYDWQGYGRYWKATDYDSTIQNQISNGALKATDIMLDRYSVKSRGFYAVVSKGYQSLVRIGLHAGINISLEDSDGDTDPTIFMATDILLSRDLAFITEYDFATNDDAVRGSNNGKGYLNVGLKWAFTNFMSLEFDIKNLLATQDGDADVRRIVKFVYHGSVK